MTDNPRFPEWKLNSIIEEYYEKSNYAGLDKLYKLIKKSNSPKGNSVEITKSDVKTFLENQEQEQILKQSRKPIDQGHITAFQENEETQIDIYDLSKYSGSNRNYKYIFAMVDVFTRKLYALPMKDKSIKSTTESLNYIITE